MEVLLQVQITSFTVSGGLPHTTVELLSLHSTNQSSASHAAPPPPKPPYFIDVGHSASFRVTVDRPMSKGAFTGEVLIHTSFDKALHIPVYYKTVIGGLKVSPEFISFEPTFPYGVAKVPLFVTNLYHQPVTVSSVRREPEDARFTIDAPEDVERGEYPRLKSKEMTQVSLVGGEGGERGRELAYTHGPKKQQPKYIQIASNESSSCVDMMLLSWCSLCRFFVALALWKPKQCSAKPSLFLSLACTVAWQCRVLCSVNCAIETLLSGHSS